MTSLCYPFIYADMIAGIVSNQWAPCFVWAFFSPQEGGQWERKEGAGVWGKIPNVFTLKLQWWKICTPSFLYFQYFHSREEWCFCYAICLGSFHSLSCIASYLTSSSYLTEVLQSPFSVLQEPVEYTVLPSSPPPCNHHWMNCPGYRCFPNYLFIITKCNPTCVSPYPLSL